MTPRSATFSTARRRRQLGSVMLKPLVKRKDRNVTDSQFRAASLGLLWAEQMKQRGISRALGDPQVRIALLTAVALMVQAVFAKNVLDVRLDVMSQNAALWVFIVFQLSGLRDRLAELAFAAAVIAVTAAVLVLYAV